MKLLLDLEEFLKEPTVAFTPFFVIFIFVEQYFSYRLKREDNYEQIDTITNLTVGTVSLLIGAFTKAVEVLFYDFLNRFALFDFHTQYWYLWVVLCFFATDFSTYWFHRISHVVRFFWAAHIVHHSSEKYNFSVALRQSWTELFFYTMFYSWLALLGFPAMVIIYSLGIQKIYGFFVHTRNVGKLGFWEIFMNTPSHHRVHHGTNVKYLDRNFAGMFIIWDKMFGTFEPEDEEPNYGITTNIKTHNIFTIITHEYINLWKDVKRAPGFKNKLNYIFNPPGWTHDGKITTSKELRRQLENNRG